MPRTEVSGVVDAEAPDGDSIKGIAVAGRRRWDEFPPEDLQEKKETHETVHPRPVPVRNLNRLLIPRAGDE